MVNIDQIEKQLLDFASGASPNPQLAHLGSLAPADAERLRSAAELLADADVAQTAAGLGILAAVARSGVNTPKLREALVAAGRRVIGSYADGPALTQALGAVDGSLSAKELANRLCILCATLAPASKDHPWTGLVSPGADLYNPDYGFGKFLEIDAMTNRVLCQYGARQPIPLAAYAAKTSVLRPGSLASRMIRQEKMDIEALVAGEIMLSLGADFIPSIEVKQAIVTRLVMPAYIKTSQKFQVWFARKKATASTTASTGATGTLADAKHLPEMVDLLAKTSPADLSETELAQLRKLLSSAIGKSSLETPFVNAVSALMQHHAAALKLSPLLRELGPQIGFWATGADIVRNSTKLKSEALTGWLLAVIAAKGIAPFAAAADQIPGKILQQLEKLLDGASLASFLEAVSASSRAGRINGDLVCWLWSLLRQRPDELRSYLPNPSVVFRAVGPKEKELKKLLMDDPDFLRFLAADGDDAGISTLVAVIRSCHGMENGDRNSLLVRITRVFPDKRQIVEEGLPSRPTMGTLPRVSSHRSHAIYAAELKEITNVLIPRNTQAISTAREHGDLRENFEFHAAKEEQKRLNGRKGELEKMLANVKPSDFTEFAVADRVVPGCEVTLEKSGGGTLVYTVLGLWDSDPKRGFISFDAPLGQVLVSRSIGDELELPDGSMVRISAIAPISATLRKELAQ